MSGSVLVRPESCGGSTGSYGAAVAASCPRKLPGLGGGVGALPTLAAAQSIQPLPLGSMFIRTSPSTRSGKMSCSEQEGRGSEGREDVSWAAPHQSHCTGLHGADVTLSWEQQETCGETAQPWHCHPGYPNPPGASAAAETTWRYQLLLFPMPWADSRYKQLRASPSQPQAHRKLGQHVGSCPNTDPDHVLEPGNTERSI